MKLNIDINVPQLEEAIIAFYKDAKQEGETLDIFCGRLIIGQTIGWKIQSERQAIEQDANSRIQRKQEQITKAGEEAIARWTEDAIASGG